MSYKLTKQTETFHKSKAAIELDVYPQVGDAGYVILETEEGHNQEFYDTVSTFTYFVLDGSGSFLVEDENIPVKPGDCISIEPHSRFYYKGTFKMLLVTTPAWREGNEVIVREPVW